MAAAAIVRMWDERDARNLDNVSRTESYLELYEAARAWGFELPWTLMAHLVSRNAGMMMTDLAAAIESPRRIFQREALEELFCLLERANFLIFYDAWRHLLEHLARVTASAVTLAREPWFRAPRPVVAAYARYEAAGARGAIDEDERSLVMDLVQNEQNLIERRVVHAPGARRARALIAFFEGVGQERPMTFPIDGPPITVGDFASLARRIETGERISDAYLREPARREACRQHCAAHPHTGARSDFGGKPGPTLREAWPAAEVRRRWPHLARPPEPDPAWS